MSNTQQLVSFHLKDDDILTAVDYLLQMIIERKPDLTEWRVTIQEEGNVERINTFKSLMSGNTEAQPQIILPS